MGRYEPSFLLPLGVLIDTPDRASFFRVSEYTRESVVESVHYTTACGSHVIAVGCHREFTSSVIDSDDFRRGFNISPGKQAALLEAARPQQAILPKFRASSIRSFFATIPPFIRSSMGKKGVFLRKGKEVIFQNQHLWIFSGAIESFPDSFEEGHLYPVHSHNGELLGHGYFRKNSSLCGRIVSFGSQDPWDAICYHLERAIAFRDRLFDLQVTNAFRLVNGEGDCLPGLIIDQYDKYLVLQSGTLGMDLLKTKIVEFLVAKKRWKGIYEKSAGSSRKEEKLSEVVSVLWGEAIEDFMVLENRLHFYVNWKKGQKTGFFLDQREMRKKVQELSFGRSVLNCFCYSGGFSVYALAGGARSATSLDASSQAIGWAKKNEVINGFPEGKSSYIEGDAFKFLSEQPLNDDLVILDPPAFAKKKQDVAQATKGYRELNYQAMAKMAKGSLLLTCSCSYYIEEAAFQTILFQAAKMAKKNVQIIGKHVLAMDHPVNLFHPESGYLKSFFLYLF